MELLTKITLLEYGFTENTEKSTVSLDVLSREGMDLIIKEGKVYYSNLGIDYPLNDLAALRKLYKEIKNKELSPL